MKSCRQAGKGLVAPLLIVGLLGPAASSRADVVDHLWIDQDNFQYRMVHIPDFDQRRAAQDGVPGLPNNGAMYCVPTSATNLLAYAANHGFPQVQPGPGNWQSQTRYNDATSFLGLLGAFMSTDANNGTGWGGWNWGLTLIIPPNTLTYTTYAASGTYAPKFRDLAQSAMNGSLVQFCHGWWSQIGEIGGVPIIQRTGGHALTMTRAYGLLFSGDELWAHDPADDAANNTQSPFTERKYAVENRLVFINSIFFARTMSNLQTTAGQWSSRYLDGYVAIRPKSGYSFTETGVIHFAPVTFWGVQTPDVFIPAQAVVDLVVGPDQNRIYYQAVDDGVYRLYCANLLDRRVIPVDVAPVTIPPKIVFGRRRHLYQLSGRILTLIDPDPEEPVVLTTRVLPFSADAFAYDDMNDAVLALDVATRSTALYPWHLDAQPEIRPLPDEGSLPLGPNVSMTWDPLRGTWWVVSDGSDDVFQLAITDGVFEVFKFGHEVLSRPTSVDVDDAGDVFVASQRRLRHFTERPAAAGSEWVLVEDSPFDVEVGPVARVTKSRTNYDPDLHEGPEWINVLPETFGEAVPACASDLNFNEAVDFGDIIAILAAWGPCPVDAYCSEDLDFSGAVDFGDLLAVLRDWGRCP